LSTALQVSRLLALGRNLSCSPVIEGWMFQANVALEEVSP
jgi:hypothetical protein